MLWDGLFAPGFRVWMVPVHGGLGSGAFGPWGGAAFSVFWGGFVAVWFEYEKGIGWMPWRQEAMKDVARCENLGGAASEL